MAWVTSYREGHNCFKQVCRVAVRVTRQEQRTGLIHFSFFALFRGCCRTEGKGWTFDLQISRLSKKEVTRTHCECFFVFPTRCPWGGVSPVFYMSWFISRCLMSRVSSELRGHCPWVWKFKKATPGNLADEAGAEEGCPKRGNQMAQKGKERLSSLGNSLEHVLVLLVVREEAEALCIMVLLRVNTEIGILVRNLIYG